MIGSYQASGTIDFDAELVFAGYGVSAPEEDWDDYAELDVGGQDRRRARRRPADGRRALRRRSAVVLRPLDLQVRAGRGGRSRGLPGDRRDRARLLRLERRRGIVVGRAIPARRHRRSRHATARHPGVAAPGRSRGSRPSSRAPASPVGTTTPRIAASAPGSSASICEEASPPSCAPSRTSTCWGRSADASTPTRRSSSPPTGTTWAPPPRPRRGGHDLQRRRRQRQRRGRLAGSRRRGPGSDGGGHATRTHGDVRGDHRRGAGPPRQRVSRRPPAGAAVGHRRGGQHRQPQRRRSHAYPGDRRRTPLDPRRRSRERRPGPGPARGRGPARRQRWVLSLRSLQLRPAGRPGDVRPQRPRDSEATRTEAGRRHARDRSRRYHTVDDEFDPTWSFAGAEQDARAILELVVRVADAPQRPRWTSPPGLAGAGP